MGPLHPARYGRARPAASHRNCWGERSPAVRNLLWAGLLEVVAAMPEELGRKRKKKKSPTPASSTSSTQSLSAAFAEIGAVEKVQKLGEVFGGARERRLLKHEEKWLTGLVISSGLQKKPSGYTVTLFPHHLMTSAS